jgi:hypothetical protein
MFCTVNDCEIRYENLDEDKPQLILPGLRFGQVQAFSEVAKVWTDSTEEDTEVMN